MPRIYRFSGFEINLEERVLYRDGKLVPLPPKALETLAVLVARQGQVVDKAFLLNQVWPDTCVEENNLTQNISALRKVFAGMDLIETIPRRGYRFLAPVEDAISDIPAVTPLSPPEPVSPAFRIRLSWVLGMSGVVLLAVVMLMSLGLSRREDRRVDSLVVLPFVNLTGNPQDQHLIDGLTEELTDAAAQIADLRVVARTSAFQFRDKAYDIRSIGRQLNVSTVLEGSVRRGSEKRLRITAQLNDAQSGYHLWSKTFECDSDDLLSVQPGIVAGLTSAIHPSAGSPAIGAQVKDREVYNLYLLGRYHRARPDEASIVKAISLFESAISKNPQFAGAYAGLGFCYLKLAQRRAMSPAEAGAAATKAVNQALALNPNLSEAHTTLATVHLTYGWNWEGSKTEFQRALALNDNDVDAHHWLSHFYSVFGLSEDSLRESRRALELSPLDLQIVGHLVFHYVRARDFRGAIQAAKQALEVDPNNQLVYLFLTWAYEDLGEWDNAIDSAQRSSVHHPDAQRHRAAVRSFGAKGYWQTQRDFLASEATPDNLRVAICDARLGAPEDALTRLEAALQKREPDLIYLGSEPAFDGIHDHPRFKAIVETMNLR